jgi:hypothetical protein
LVAASVADVFALDLEEWVLFGGVVAEAVWDGSVLFGRRSFSFVLAADVAGTGVFVVGIAESGSSTVFKVGVVVGGVMDGGRGGSLSGVDLVRGNCSVGGVNGD